MDRRTFLSRTMAGGAVAFTSSWQMAHAAATHPSLLIVRNVTPRSSASALVSFLDPITSQNLPVCIAVKFGPEDWENADQNASLMEALQRLTIDYPGLVDLAIELPGLASELPYLRMRSASEARNRFQHAMVKANGTYAPQTVITDMQDGEPPTLEGLRSTGFLTSFLIPESGRAPTVWRNADGTQQVNGGWRLPPSPTSDQIANTFAQATSQDGPLVFVASFPDDNTQEEDAFFDQGAILGDAFRRNLTSSRNYFILPSELRFRSGTAFARNMVLCVEADGSDKTSDSLRSQLAAANVPFTALLPAARAESIANGLTETGAHQCLMVSNSDMDDWQDIRNPAFETSTTGTDEPVHCIALDRAGDGAPDAPALAGFEVILDTAETEKGDIGFDAQGALRLRTSVVIDTPVSAQKLLEDLLQTIPSSEDVTLRIKESAFTQPEDAHALVNSLVELAQSDQFRVLDLQQFFKAVTTKSEPARLLRSASRWPARITNADMEPNERARLFEDAKMAWSYFDGLTDPDTGLVPATAWVEDNQIETYRFSTMWDTGTLLLAIVSAHSIGILDDDAFELRLKKALDGLSTGTFNGLRLPKGLTSTDGKAKGDDDYNASDTARLLTSLHLVQSYAKQDLGIGDIVRGWDLEKTIQDGTPMTVRGSKLVSAYQSNYAGYIARGFGLWGYPVTSPYTDPRPGSRFDQGVQILHEVAQFGPIGTEPHLLEAVELGASPLAHTAAEALFAAQIDEYRATGKLVCVSEGPVNREPWFVYQGYQIADDGGKWTAETLDPSPRFQTKGFVRAVDMLNSKGAFLWNAHRPNDYTDRLVNQVREKAATSELGFSPGVFSVTGKSDQAYSDVNTNGVILQAIAFRLNGGIPCSEWAQ
ncbi:hypothetical protein ALP8811_02197 [Aliiroseovarius pelagivivens]|uniref:DUF3131 domain-containing protein n=1 Tax=Aliiroseovarius pelagivivens TaxID=1639690 RepID=A0A2R8AMT8_9RHOB|nr:DUF3131 domain-containing protein [Aliiroseovarius pelagivivens]SPF77174.1 hypothetical protein ALP8811_02197 [Aliiroseovarius pelagivivens]